MRGKRSAPNTPLAAVGLARAYEILLDPKESWIPVTLKDGDSPASEADYIRGIGEREPALSVVSRMLHNTCMREVWTRISKMQAQRAAAANNLQPSTKRKATDAAWAPFGQIRYAQYDTGLFLARLCVSIATDRTNSSTYTKKNWVREYCSIAIAAENLAELLKQSSLVKSELRNAAKYIPVDAFRDIADVIDQRLSVVRRSKGRRESIERALRDALLANSEPRIDICDDILMGLARSARGICSEPRYFPRARKITAYVLFQDISKFLYSSFSLRLEAEVAAIATATLNRQINKSDVRDWRKNTNKALKKKRAFTAKAGGRG